VNLYKLLKPWVSFDRQDIEILNLENDSRKVQKGTLFFAYPGVVTDGRNYIDEAIANGARAVVYDPHNFVISKKYLIPVVALENLKNKLADIAAFFYSNPTQSLKVIGVTGTNGKTTVAYQLAKAFELLGEKSAYIGTIGQGIVGALHELDNTTPDGICLQKLFSEYYKSGVNQVCMEVSSHALVEGRTRNIAFQQAIYTNLSHEHLDFHRTMDDYAQAKAKLFSESTLHNIIVNIDDAYAQIMLNSSCKNIIKTTYAMQRAADFQALDCKYGLDGCKFTVKSKYKDIKLAINGIGAFNIYNSLAIFASLMFYDYVIDDVAQVVQKLLPVNGRMELIAKAPYVFVDYSHTPDALENALLSLVNIRNQSNNTGKIWVVFGCGGDRDTTKRPLMGQIACKYADEVVITSDNPRTEDPEKIIADICANLNADKKINKITNRRGAISFAIHNAKHNDTILIAGKGHEEYQIIGREKFYFSDKKVVLEVI
jgi:UDP-N-acetylmuramoyl-L-alanyl-D-glutamate--2,6-diaminopimelate ligase